MLPIARFRIYGHSMEPIIKNGQTVLISSTPYLFSKPKIGDIVAFKKDKKVFIKRIAEIKNQKYFMTGDNRSDSMDSIEFGWINRKDIIGKVIFKV